MGFWFSFRPGSSDRRCFLRQCSRVWTYIHLEPVARSANLDQSDRWPVPVLPGHQDVALQTRRDSGFCKRPRASWLLRLNTLPDAHESYDHSLFCGDIHRSRYNQQCWGLYLVSITGRRCLHWLDTMVVDTGRRREPVPGQVQHQFSTLDQQNLRRRSHGFWVVVTSQSSLAQPSSMCHSPLFQCVRLVDYTLIVGLAQTTGIAGNRSSSEPLLGPLEPFCGVWQIHQPHPQRPACH